MIIQWTILTKFPKQIKRKNISLFRVKTKYIYYMSVKFIVEKTQKLEKIKISRLITQGTFLLLD